MESITEPIDLTDVRNELSLSRDDGREDDFLMSAITVCRDRLEGILPFYLAERSVTVTFEVDNLDTLDYVINKLRSIKGVYNVYRKSK